MMAQQPPKKPVFKIWPPFEPYGPRPKQRLLFIEELPDEDTYIKDHNGNEINIKRPHYHPLDIVLFIGGARRRKNNLCCIPEF